ncbi:DELLA protein [Heracleum sosnowskyi]|uniref:DELLA protein n=1 Tax=Heracleum sosnowskyi TaxID=360622 RepID=A0AAD8MBD8_9APIA|nr:DELLA protein [Heracleum sosnowskyi]
MKSDSGSSLDESQESELVQNLLACAKAIQEENLELADSLVDRINFLSLSYGGAMRKVANYFTQALAQRINKIPPQGSPEASYLDMHQPHFLKSYPYMNFGYYTANQAIVEAASNVNRVHIIDLSLKHSIQWQVLLQAFAMRLGGPPTVRLTAIGLPQADNTDSLREVGSELAHWAASMRINFEFHGFEFNSLTDIDASLFDIRPREEEVLAVNSAFELHRLLAEPGAIEKVLNSIALMNPKIVTLVEQESSHNSPVFYDRFSQALDYYFAMFDSHESTGFTKTYDTLDLRMSDVYLGRQICNVLSCEGPDRVERHETLSQWRERMCAAGFEPIHLGPKALVHANLVLALFGGGNGYQVQKKDGGLMLSWDSRSLVATSAWQLAAAAP